MAEKQNKESEQTVKPSKPTAAAIFGLVVVSLLAAVLRLGLWIVRPKLVWNESLEENKQFILDRIKAIYADDQDKKSPGFALRSCAKIIADESVPLGLFQNLFFPVSAVLIIIIVCYYISSLALVRGVSGLEIVQAAVSMIGFSVAALWLLIRWANFWNWATRWGAIGLYVAAFAVLIPRVLMFTGNYLREPKGLILRAATDGIFVCGLAVIPATLFFQFYELSEASIRDRRRWDNPVPYLLWELFKALEWVSLELTEPLWLDPPIRNELVGYLESAARCVEFFPQRFAVPQRVAALGWVSAPDDKQYYLRRAAGLRKMKTRVCLPKPDSPEYIQQELRHVLDLVSAGQWDDLPVADPPAMTPLSWWKRALNLVRSLAIALLPVVIVSTLDANQRLPAQFSAYILAASWIWAMISLLSALDPRFGQKLSAFKDLPSFLTISSKSKEDKH